jgi:hypothetical protein
MPRLDKNVVNGLALSRHMLMLRQHRATSCRDPLAALLRQCRPTLHRIGNRDTYWILWVTGFQRAEIFKNEMKTQWGEVKIRRSTLFLLSSTILASLVSPAAVASFSISS